ncbi:uncharacterized protein FIESC28_09063 [Fusarium coffeatum]|uniref:Uncharacterized protein n=1 Tax=Fusarium coffeatum TaxID=231269 RepID=A0A366R2U6_9HYPO|nr:uncharacterized protein FIESC28_09063 [Fusarium coffeatum]RBR11449.1 hypothetical protein FIESC28_09063 [Fusarium coffeatum]
MPSTNNTSSQKPGYPLGCNVMKQPEQKPGYPLGCIVINLTTKNAKPTNDNAMAKCSLSNDKLEEDGDDMARRGFNGLFTFAFTWL